MTISPYPYPLGIPRVGNITPFTVRSGASFLEILESLSSYVRDELIPFLDQLHESDIEEFQNQILTFQTEIERRVMEINNRVGPVNLQRRTLQSDIATRRIDIDPVWPDKHPILFQVTQDENGGRSLILGTGIMGTVDLDMAPNSVTEFELIPMEGGTWRVYQPFSSRIGGVTDALIALLIGQESDIASALDSFVAQHIGQGLPGEFLSHDQTFRPLNKNTIGLNNVDNTSDTDKPVSQAQQAALNLKSRNFAGTYANRPGATAVGIRDGDIYHATNTNETYQVVNGVWKVITPPGLLGIFKLVSVVERAPLNGTDMDWKDIPNVSVTFIAGERPVRVTLSGDMAVSNPGRMGRASLWTDNTLRMEVKKWFVVNATWESFSKSTIIEGLTPGQTYNVRLRMAPDGDFAPDLNWVRIDGNQNNPSVLTVEAL